MNFEDCVELWNNRHNAAHRKLDNKTYLEFDGTDFFVTLFGKSILFHHPDGSVTYDHCGWPTVTTKDRMNKYGMRGWSVTQENRIWYIYQHRSDLPWGEQPTFPFANGITVYPDGTITGVGTDPKAEKKLQEKVRKYSKDFVKQLVAGKLGEPGAGDCFYCQMVVQGGEHNGEPLGDAQGDKSHLLMHLEEKYYVPSLLMNAIKQSNTSIACQQSAYGYLFHKSEYVFPGDFIQDQIAKAITWYLRRHLELA